MDQLDHSYGFFYLTPQLASSEPDDEKNANNNPNLTINEYVDDDPTPQSLAIHSMTRDGDDDDDDRKDDDDDRRDDGEEGHPDLSQFASGMEVDTPLKLGAGTAQRYAQQHQQQQSQPSHHLQHSPVLDRKDEVKPFASGVDVIHHHDDSSLLLDASHLVEALTDRTTDNESSMMEISNSEFPPSYLPGAVTTTSVKQIVAAPKVGVAETNDVTPRGERENRALFGEGHVPLDQASAASDAVVASTASKFNYASASSSIFLVSFQEARVLFVLINDNNNKKYRTKNKQQKQQN